MLEADGMHVRVVVRLDAPLGSGVGDDAESEETDHLLTGRLGLPGVEKLHVAVCVALLVQQSPRLLIVRGAVLGEQPQHEEGERGARDHVGQGHPRLPDPRTVASVTRRRRHPEHHVRVCSRTGLHPIKGCGRAHSSAGGLHHVWVCSSHRCRAEVDYWIGPCASGRRDEAEVNGGLGYREGATGALASLRGSLSRLRYAPATASHGRR
mmetsp:Transcript_34080/g.80422  ORF Transcript_34080/g.80422 Transcript_34080/m.80422 type:complete len:209 (+) Transcript_34080:866-1492(+)